MCRMCDDPDLTSESYMEHVQELLTERRFLIQSVDGSARSSEFSYTVGLTAHGLPELVVVGRRSENASRLLGAWADYLLEDSLVLAGETLQSGTLVMEAVEVERPQEHLLVAVAVYGACLLYTSPSPRDS